jgi:hypothetical protein
MKRYLKAVSGTGPKGAHYQYRIPERIVDGKKLREVVLPKSSYRESDSEFPRNRILYYKNAATKEGWFSSPVEGAHYFKCIEVVEVDDEMYEAIQADPNVQDMIKQGRYIWLDELPSMYHDQKDELIAALKGELLKAGIPLPKVGAKVELTEEQKKAKQAEFDQWLKEHPEAETDTAPRMQL